MSTANVLRQSLDVDPAYEEMAVDCVSDGTHSSGDTDGERDVADLETKGLNEESTSSSKANKSRMVEAPFATEASETGRRDPPSKSSALPGTPVWNSPGTAASIESADTRGKGIEQELMKHRQASQSTSLVTDKRSSLASLGVVSRHHTYTWTSTSTTLDKEDFNSSALAGENVPAPGEGDNDTASDTPTTSGNWGNKRKPTEMCTVLLNGTVLRFTTAEGDSAWSETLGDSLRTRGTPGAGPKPITPLPDGQFYNTDGPGENIATQAIYRKRDTHGVPVVFNTTLTEVSFWDVNPNHFARDLRAVAGDEILSHRMTNYGALVLYVKSGEMAQELLKLTTVAGVPVTVHVPRDYSRNLGKIRTVPFHYTDANIVAVLARYGVVGARRQLKNLRKRDGTNERISRSTVILTFRDDQELPPYVRLGFLKFRVEPYVEAPVQCRNCQGFWHMSRSCHKGIRCRTCAGPHHHSACTYIERPRCANCRGPHTAIHFRCPVRLEACRKKRFDLALQ